MSVYGLGFFALDVEPVVIQVPDFGDRFFVYAFYDARTDQFGHIGKALQHEAWLLPARWAELARVRASGHQRGRAQPDRTRERDPAHLPQ
jgi:hypothetical protein